ncbi:hypothetical protein D3879_09555 [Pseudomonas cavernicola]|uniref:DUF1367 domain-containing protein n=1 Tax=Pseudomonas cavernicola TaxID=2320866 RepID=A0A418XM07_9PSED|nr:hypothetical protein [Pseudomonas cavernicola]RJG13471.1 hypothetical protein D3879_09555 [Pseudomonas cavernicola]
MAEPKKSTKRADRPIYMTVRKLVNPKTGEEVSALVPGSGIDSYLMHELGLRTGDDVRAVLKLPRNAKFHRLVHALGKLVAEQIEDFQGLSAHDAIKRLQRESGICCEVQSINLPGFGALDVAVAQSIAFDEMDEGAFRELYKGICRHICERYWPTLTPEQVADMAELMTAVE